MNNFKLTFFNGRGKAELIRWIFEQSDVAYEDCRLERGDWTKLKQGAPFYQLPILEIDGQVFSQSSAIARFLAKQFGLDGETLEEEAETDMVVNCCEDLVNGVAGAYFEEDADKKAELKSKFEEKIKPQLSMLESILESNNGGDAWVIGDKVTWADLAMTIYTGDRIGGESVSEIVCSSETSYGAASYRCLAQPTARDPEVNIEMLQNCTKKLV